MNGDICCRTIGVFGDSSCPRLPELIHCRNCPEYARAGRLLFDRPQPRAERDQWTELLSREKKSEPAGMISAVIFKAGGEWFALKTQFLQEITDQRPVHTVPYRSGDRFRGLVNINGELLLCLDPAAVLALAPQPSACRRMIVAAQGASRFVLLAGDILGVRRIAPGDVAGPPATVARFAEACTAGIFTHEGKTVGLLEETAFFEALARSIAP